MSDLDTLVGTSGTDPDRERNLPQRDSRATPLQPGGVFRPADQIDTRRTQVVTAEVEPSSGGHALRNIIVIATAALAGAAAAVGLSAVNNEEGGKPGQVLPAISPLGPDRCSEAYGLPSYTDSDTELLPVYDMLNQEAVGYDGSGKNLTDPPTNWLAVSFPRKEGVSKYALVLHAFPRSNSGGALGGVAVIPFDPNVLQFDEEGVATVYIPTPSTKGQLLVVDYDENRPGGPVGTTSEQFAVGAPDPTGISRIVVSLVCNIVSDELVYTRHYGQDPTGVRPDGSSGNHPDGAPDEGTMIS